VDDLWAVGAWYQRFEPVSDTEVLRLLAKHSRESPEINQPAGRSRTKQQS
jgi:predicted phosphoribosyltransferase